jgi:hypothetical protein
MDASPSDTTEIHVPIPDLPTRAPTTGGSTMTIDVEQSLFVSSSLPTTTASPTPANGNVPRDPAFESINSLEAHLKKYERHELYIRIGNAFACVLWGFAVTVQFFYLDTVTASIFASKVLLTTAVGKIILERFDQYHANAFKKQMREITAMDKSLFERMLRCGILHQTSTMKTIQQIPPKVDFYSRIYNALVLALFGYLVIIPSLPFVVMSVAKCKILWTIVAIEIIVGGAFLRYKNQENARKRKEMATRMAISRAENCRKREIAMLRRAANAK